MDEAALRQRLLAGSWAAVAQHQQTAAHTTPTQQHDHSHDARARATAVASAAASPALVLTSSCTYCASEVPHNPAAYTRHVLRDCTQLPPHLRAAAIQAIWMAYLAPTTLTTSNTPDPPT